MFFVHKEACNAVNKSIDRFINLRITGRVKSNLHILLIAYSIACSGHLKISLAGRAVTFYRKQNRNPLMFYNVI